MLTLKERKKLKLMTMPQKFRMAVKGGRTTQAEIHNVRDFLAAKIAHMHSTHRDRVNLRKAHRAMRSFGP